MQKFILILSFLFFFINSSFINETQNKSYHLFKIERSKDANEIFYDINTEKTGCLNINNPINPYWIRATEGGLLKPLTWIQQNYAYGLEYAHKSENQAKFHFVSYKKRDFILKRNAQGYFKVFTQLNQKEVIVNRIFIQIDGGTFWFPKISQVELHVQDPTTNKKLIEIITP